MRYDSGTIAAVSTAPGEGAIAIVRISGPDAAFVLGNVFRGRVSAECMKSGRMYHGKAAHGAQNIDEVLAVLFRAPKSYTREDVAEIHCHGGSYAAARVLAACLEYGCRPAEPGEFTLRAFLNGRIDLSEAEAVMDIISSKSSRAARHARELADGALSRNIAAIAVELTAALASLEVALDYPEEEIALDERENGKVSIANALEKARVLLSTAHSGRVMRSGASVAIAGRPNVGKSSVFNALLDENRAIISGIPGTTRDVLEEQMSVEGIPLRLIDTAGLRESADPVEREGIERAKKAAGVADAVLYVMDATIPYEAPMEFDGGTLILVVNKVDLGIDPSYDRIGESAVYTSAMSGEGISKLKQLLAGRLMSADDDMPLVSERHADCLRRAVLSLESALIADAPEFIAEDARYALDSLWEITGQTVSEAVINSIFSRFCLGK